jgi:hypothetical protein
LVTVKKAVAAIGKEAVKFSVPGTVMFRGSSVTNLEKCWCALTVVVANRPVVPAASVKKKSTVTSVSFGFAIDRTDRPFDDTFTNNRPTPINGGVVIASSLTSAPF